MASNGADVTRVGFIGLGAMGFGMACNLLKKPQYQVQGFDVYPPSAEKFVAQGGSVGSSPREVAKISDILVCMAANAQQIDDILFNHQTGALETLPEHATVLLCSTVPPTYHEALPDRIAKKGRSDVLVVDGPVSGGTKRAAEGTLTIFATGTSVALQRADKILHDMSEKLYIIPGGPGAGSKVKMVNQLLVGTHIAAASEAMGLAAKAGLNTREVYNIITNAAGNSWAFENRVPHMLDGDWTPLSALNIFVKDMGIVVSTARTLQFPVPLASTAEQLYIQGAAQGLGLDDDAGLVRVFLPGNPELVKEQAGQVSTSQEKLTPSSTPLEISKIGMIGLGAMGQGMAGSLLRAGFPVHGYDVYEPAIDKFVATGGKATKASSPSDAAKGADLLVLMVQNAAQADDALFGSGKAAEVLPDGAIIILSSTVPPSFVRELESKLTNLGKGISLIDAPVSGGVVRAANGTLTIICSGDDAIISKVNAPLMAMTGTSSNLCHVQGGVGAASSVKLINQLLAGVHIAAAAEAMALAARLGLDTRRVFDLLGNAAGWSWMFENRVPQMLDADWTPHSALAIFVKDLGIVLDEAKRLTYFAPISSAAHTLYLSGAAHGWTKESDAGVVRLWELTGISVSGNAGPKQENKSDAAASPVVDQDEALPAQKTLDALPAEYSDDVISSTQKVVNNGEVPVLIALDDDPTGTQTCNDIDVLTVWDAATLDYEFSLNPKGFFILTNSRALPSAEARQLILEICQNVKKAAEKAGKAFEIVLRGDSTLRGHLPEEPEAAEEALGKFDAWVVTPFFFQGGRLTINDVHYVKEGDVLVPASHTPFAQDATFGYKNSNLRKYILEKCGHRFDESSFLSVTLDDIRLGGPAGVAKKLLSAAAGSNTVVIVNAAAESDMHVFVAGLLEANKSGRRYLFRTGAAFVSSRLGIIGIPPLTMADLGVSVTEPKQPGGLIVAGSYVPKTTAQLKVLRERRGDKLAVIELDVADLVASDEAAEKVVEAAATETTKRLSAGEDVLVMTSRELIKGHDALSSLQIGSKVARALVQLVEKIDVRPRYLIAKGGITSSDAATKGLKMRRARILGQAAPGVPLWRCDEETSRHRGVPYVVFPGNVGSDQTLADVVESWTIASVA